MTEPESITPAAASRHYFGGRPVDPAMTGFITGLSLGLLLLLVVALRPPLDELPSAMPLHKMVRYLEAENSDSLVEHLQHLGIWELAETRSLPPVVFSAFPPDIGDQLVDTRKRIFLHSLAPTALVALAEVERERAELLRVIGRMALDRCTLDQLLDGAVDHATCGLSRDEADFLEELSAKYRSEHLDVLLNRVNVVPLSLILAQAAIESSWGGSRFALEGNNIFGIWTWGEHGMVPTNRAQGMTHRVAIYESLLDSVRSYLLMLNRVAAYRTLRDIRRESMDSLALINGLRYYSEKRDVYVDDLRTLITVNRLQDYDHLTLAPYSPPGLPAVPPSGPADRAVAASLD